MNQVVMRVHMFDGRTWEDTFGPKHIAPWMKQRAERTSFMYGCIRVELIRANGTLAHVYRVGKESAR